MWSGSCAAAAVSCITATLKSVSGAAPADEAKREATQSSTSNAPAANIESTRVESGLDLLAGTWKSEVEISLTFVVTFVLMSMSLCSGVLSCWLTCERPRVDARGRSARRSRRLVAFVTFSFGRFVSRAFERLTSGTLFRCRSARVVLISRAHADVSVASTI